MQYGISHPDDISGLIVHWARAILLGEPFDAVAHCQLIQEHWQQLGKSPMGCVAE